MRPNYLIPEYKYLLSEMDVSYLHDSALDVTEQTVEDKSRKVASIYYCGTLLTCFPIPNLSEAREMARQCGWTKIVDEFTLFRCMLDECLDGVQRRQVAKIAMNAWKRAHDETRKSFDIQE